MSLVKSKEDKEAKKLVDIPKVWVVLKLMDKNPYERTEEEVILISRFFSKSKFFSKLIEEGNGEAVDQCSKEMTLEVINSQDFIINFGEIGDKFYVVISGSVDIYIPQLQTFDFTLKQYLEFVIPKRKFIKKVNDNSDYKLPQWIEILEFTNEGLINMEKLEEFLDNPHKNVKGFSVSIIRQLHATNSAPMKIEFFIKVATLGDGFEFGADALTEGKPRNATVVAEKRTHLAVLTKDKFHSILKTLEQKRKEKFLEKLNKFTIIEHFSRTYKAKLLRYFQEVTFKRGQYLYKDGDNPDSVYFLLDGEIELSKVFKIQTMQNKNYVYYDGMKGLNNKPIEDSIKKVLEGQMLVDVMIDSKIKRMIQSINVTLPPHDQSFKKRITKRIVILAKYSPYQIIGTMETMLGAKSR